jgi:hypothetical protein
MSQNTPWRVLLAVAAASAVVPAAAQAATPLTPSADLYVSGKAPTTNFGAARQLVVTRRPASRAFLRFDLGSAPAPDSRVVLYLRPLTGSKSGLRLRHASDAPWNERRITLASAPGTGPRVVHTGALRAKRWKAIDVTRLVDASGVVALSLATSGRERIVLASREARTGASRLVVQPASAPVAAAPPALAVAPAAAPSLAMPAAVPPPVPPAPPAPPAGPVPTSANPCGVTAAPPAAWEHIVWIIMENHSYGQVMGTSATPSTNALAAKCGVASNFWAESRPSLPNYIAMTSGDPQGISDDNAPASHPLNVPSIFSQLGNDWRSPQESMPANCALTSSGSYAVKHNPAAYYTNIREACNRLNVPMTDPPDVSARFTFITPNMCNSTHDCSTQVGDAFLGKTITKILDSVFLTWDEGAGDQHIATVVMSPSTPVGMVDATNYNHYSMLRTTEEMLGLPAIGGAVMAPSMRAAFHL